MKNGNINKNIKIWKNDRIKGERIEVISLCAKKAQNVENWLENDKNLLVLFANFLSLRGQYTKRFEFSQSTSSTVTKAS